MQQDVTAFGEVMLRLSVPAGERLSMANALSVTPAGAESNVLGALAQLGHSSGFVTALPDNPPGQRALYDLRAAGVDFSNVIWRGSGRVGLIFAELAVPPRATQVVYDRAGSCAAGLTVDDLPWDYLMATKIHHATGITLAVSASLSDCVREARAAAIQAGAAFSFDVNYRSRLWSPEQAAPLVMEMAEAADILFCKHEDALLLFGCTGNPESACRQLASMTAARWVVMTAGADGVYGCFNGEVLHQPARRVTILDRVGAGDALAAGVLHAWLRGQPLADALRAGSTLAALALSQFGDMVHTHPAELDQLLGQEQPLVQR